MGDLRLRRGALAFVVPVLAGLLSIPTGAMAAGRPTGPLALTSGAWFGGSVNQVSNDGVNGGQAEITTRETFLGRRYDIINRFYGYNAAVPTSLETWDVSMGRIPMITWGAPEDTIRLASGVDDNWLTAQANRFAAFGSPIYLRFFHEMDGDYRRSYVHSAQDFIAAWRHVHDIFVQRGATNVVWIWCPTAWKFTTGSSAQTYYPGDAYVDWIAADGYSWYPVTGGWRTWTQIFQPFYDWASTMNKPIMIAENGALEDPAMPNRKASWIANSQAVMKTTYPLIQAVVYFDIVGNLNGTALHWPVDSSQASYNAYRTMGADPYFNPPHGTSDTTPPSQPGTPGGVSNSSSSIDLSWTASTDAVSSSIVYRVMRDAVQVGTVTSSSTTTVGYTDIGLAPSSVHTYAVVAVDGAGNASLSSATSNPITVQASPPPTSIFADDFSSGNLASWSGVTRLTIDGTTGGLAPPSARAQTSGQSGWAFKSLPATYNSICLGMRVNVTSTGGGAVVLLRLRTVANGPVTRVWVNAAGVLWVKSDVSGQQLSTGAALGAGWHGIELCGTVGAAGAWSLYRDGTPIVNNWVVNTGTTPVGRIEIGDTAAGTFTVNFDDVVVDQAAG